jgi:hypothetical protein
MTAIVKSKTKLDAHEMYVAAMWLMFLRAPGRNTLLGEPVDLGEIGQVKSKNWERLTPYSPAEPLR